MRIIFSLLFLLVLGLPGVAWAQVGCVPNPNLSAPPFVDGCPLPASALNKLVSSPSKLVTAYGADPAGVADSTAAFTACLAAAGSMGTCSAANGKYLISGSFSIPASATLSCGLSFADQEDSNIAGFGTLPALMLGGTISASGESASIRNCLIYRSGMTFPAANSSAFTGIAINDLGFGGLSVTDDVILGFDTAIYISGPRPYINRVYADGTGVTHAVIDVENGNTDSGFIANIKIQPIATGNGSCTASLRAGTGLKMNGINGIEGLNVIQNFLVSDWEIDAYTIADTLWADGLAASCPTQYSGQNGYGVYLAPAGGLNANHVDLNGVVKGLVVNAECCTPVSIGRVFFNVVTGDCLYSNDNAGGGLIAIGSISTNGLNAGANCGGYLMNFAGTSGQNTYLQVGQIFANNVHAGVAPYFNAAASMEIGRNLIITQFLGDLTAGSNYYSSNFLAGNNAESSISAIKPSVGSCTGLGTGACSLSTAHHDQNQGSITLLPTGSPSATGGATLTLLSDNTGRACSFQVLGVNWAGGATTVYDPIDATHVTVVWTNNGTNLSAGLEYDISYICRTE